MGDYGGQGCSLCHHQTGEEDPQPGVGRGQLLLSPVCKQEEEMGGGGGEKDG